MSSFFDAAAKTYDDTFTYTKIGKAQRNKVYENLSYVLSSDKQLHILELNCGTGVDAVTFAQKNHNVIATDISEEMIKVASARNNHENLIFKVLDVKNLRRDTFRESFDMVFSNFGGLNCLSIEELNTFIKTVSQLLKPQGKLFMVLMPKNCAWEQIYFLAKGAVKKAKRRNTNQSLLVNVDGEKVPTWYFNPKDIVEITQEHFSVTNYFPIGITVPPSYLEKSFLTKKPFWNILENLEKRLSNRFLARYADHFLIELTKK
ncbi:class I SAM-dependent methyltransferase [Tenacibaculum sp. 190524A02b]|uniref:class I SAM-dependent methyltransferase n=1 Tax=Tenacibaculum vairaonense TaxID=3137860 RepID=UPI0031FAD686